jgi:hypothetical protein
MQRNTSNSTYSYRIYTELYSYKIWYDWTIILILKYYIIYLDRTENKMRNNR